MNYQTAKVEMHPSGLTMDRWDHPFKTTQERQLVINYFDKVWRQSLKINHLEKQKMIESLPEATW